MPTYAYRGTACAHEFEAYQSFKDDPLTECAECGGPVRRVIQPTGIVFKGSGWYITDSRKGTDSPMKSEKAESTTETNKPAAATATANQAAAD